MFTLILLDTKGKPFRTIGPFEYEDSCGEWLKENGISCAYVVLELEAHGWDN